MTAIVDDRDPRITYTGDWFLGGGPPEHQNTTHGTTTAGSSASFNFTGTSVGVYGTVGPTEFYHVDVGSPVSIYNLDHFPAVSFYAPALNSASYHYQFYISPPLDEGIHYLVITSVNMSSVLWLDYLQYTPSSNSSSSNVTPSSAPNGSSSATIIGGTIGGALFLVLLILGAFWSYRRRKQKQLYHADDSSHASQGFLMQGRSEDLTGLQQSYPNTNSSPRTRGWSTTTYGHLTPFPLESSGSSPWLGLRPLPQTPPNLNRQGVMHPAAISDNTTLGTNEKRGSSIAPSQQRFSQGGTMYRLHSDGGVRVEGGPPRPLRSVDVPPDYQEYN